MASDVAMSHEQMLHLLQQAHTRLQKKTDVSIMEKSAIDLKIPARNSLLAIAEAQLKGPESNKSLVTTTQHPGLAKSDNSLRARTVEDPVAVQKQKSANKRATAGQQWYNLPKTDLTPELKRDLQLLKMRNVLDPHRHYKKGNGKMAAPEFSQIGRIIEGPTEYFSGRIDNKSRKRTFVEEILEAEQQTGRFGRKYGDIQVKKTSGKKAHYKAVKAKRTTSYKKS